MAWVWTEAEGLAPDDFVILCTGELNANKNQTTLVSAAALLKDEIPRLKILLAGNGPKEQALREQIHAEGLDGIVRLIGYRTDLERVVPAVDLVVSCSKREGMPLNIIEAMLCGKPVVASHNRGHDELVRDGVTGRLLPFGDVPAFAAAIRSVYRNAAQTAAMGQNGRREIQPYTIAAVGAELNDLLQAVRD